jgi:NTP pyrophosphatase (non-canonical NTP hydrolase)
MSDLRLVTRFADAMAERLEANAHKSGWERMSVTALLVRAEQELGELRRAVERGEGFGRIRGEAADVGNFLGMLVAVYGEHEPPQNNMQMPSDHRSEAWWALQAGVGEGGLAGLTDAPDAPRGTPEGLIP